MTGDGVRALPAIHLVMASEEIRGAIEARGRPASLRAVRSAIGRAREAIQDGRSPAIDVRSIARDALAILDRDGPNLRPVLNASGILLHTGLGRAARPEAVEAVANVARGYCNLEFDLESGERGSRASSVVGLLRELTGAEAAAVVNNNAAATILALRATSSGREVIVSRGQLVEIGGSFRLPEILAVSGAILREVGTTNKTRLSDYERAITPETAALMRVHPSNYRVVGFTESVPIAELARLAKSRGILAIDDIGSGAIDSALPPGVRDEPTIREGLQAGADLVLFSGDKLLGGPQSGIILGSKATVSRLTADPLMRAFRVDKMTLAALEATLRVILDRGGSAVPLWRFLATPAEALRGRAERLSDEFRANPGLETRAVETSAYLGGGSVPTDRIASWAVRIGPPWPGSIADEAALARRLRTGRPSVVPRIEAGSVLLDLRAIPDDQDGRILEAVRRAVAGEGG